MLGCLLSAALLLHSAVAAPAASPPAPAAPTAVPAPVAPPPAPQPAGPAPAPVTPPPPTPAAAGDVFVSGPAGATLALDGKPTGVVAPGMIKQVPAGTHIVAIRQGCMVSEQAIEVHAQAIEHVDPAMHMGSAALTITTNMDGAGIAVDGKPVGTAPLAPQALACGTHQIGATLPGYLPAQASVTIEPGQPLAVTLTLARQQVGTIAVDVTPVTAAVYLDGEPEGSGPRTLGTIPIGPHSVTARLRGYTEGSQPVIVAPDTISRVTLSLAPLPSLHQRMATSKVRWTKVGDATGLTLIAGGAFTGAYLLNRSAQLNYATYLQLNYQDSPEVYYKLYVQTPRTISWVIAGTGALCLLGSGVYWLEAGGVHLHATPTGIAGTF